MEDFSYLLISLLMVAVGLSLGLPFYLRRRDAMQSGPSAHTKEEALAVRCSVSLSAPPLACAKLRAPPRSSRAG